MTGTVSRTLPAVARRVVGAPSAHRVDAPSDSRTDRHDGAVQRRCRPTGQQESEQSAEGERDASNLHPVHPFAPGETRTDHRRLHGTEEEQRPGGGRQAAVGE